MLCSVPLGTMSKFKPRAAATPTRASAAEVRTGAWCLTSKISEISVSMRAGLHKSVEALDLGIWYWLSTTNLRVLYPMEPVQELASAAMRVMEDLATPLDYGALRWIRLLLSTLYSPTVASSTLPRRHTQTSTTPSAALLTPSA